MSDHAAQPLRFHSAVVMGHGDERSLDPFEAPAAVPACSERTCVTFMPLARRSLTQSETDDAVPCCTTIRVATTKRRIIPFDTVLPPHVRGSNGANRLQAGCDSFNNVYQSLNKRPRLRLIGS